MYVLCTLVNRIDRWTVSGGERFDEVTFGVEYGAVAFFDLEGGVRLALWPRASISRDTGLPESEGSPTDLALGHNVSSKDEVDRVMSQADEAGAVIVKAAAATFWGGYAGYFQDPDGHLWEVAWNPGMLPEE